MKQSNLYFAFILSLLFMFSCATRPASDLSSSSLIPYPDLVFPNGQWFDLSKPLIISYANKNLASTATQLAKSLEPFGLTAKTDAGMNGDIRLIVQDDSVLGLGAEGYSLVISQETIEISASTAAGSFYGAQTLIQLISEATQGEESPRILPTGKITDKPAFAWRGSMLDVSRHFFSVADVKRYIDLISHYKMNVLHLHLTDDQGWRIEIKSWPNLTTVGGSTQVGGGKGGFYTQQEYADIVQYAAERHITIIPEVDLPGHINAALASYGELNDGTVVPEKGRIANPQKNIDPKNPFTDLYGGIEVGWSTLSLKKAKTLTFIDDVIRELAAITPGPYLHIGGDEAHATGKEDYIAFINAIEGIVKKYDKVMIGWEEIAQANIDSNAIAQYWNSEGYAQQAVAKGATLIMSPSKKVYLDMQYDSTTRIGLHWAAYIEVDDAYRWDPATHIKGIETSHIRGVEAPLWSETVVTMDDIEYLVFPRLTAVAEVAWTPASGRDWESYARRLGNHAPHFDMLGISYYASPRITWKP